MYISQIYLARLDFSFFVCNFSYYDKNKLTMLFICDEQTEGLTGRRTQGEKQYVSQPFRGETYLKGE